MANGEPPVNPPTYGPVGSVPSGPSESVSTTRVFIPSTVSPSTVPSAAWTDATSACPPTATTNAPSAPRGATQPSTTARDTSANASA